MPNTPLNPDALANLRLLADRATEEVRHAVIEPDILHKLLDLAVAQPVLDETALANLIAWKSLPFGATQFVKLDANAAHKVIELLKPHLTVAQPVVNSVESIPAKMRMLMWEGGEVEVGEIPDGFVLVGFEMETDRAWSMADNVTINIERPEVKP